MTQQEYNKNVATIESFGGWVEGFNGQEIGFCSYAPDGGYIIIWLDELTASALYDRLNGQRLIYEDYFNRHDDYVAWIEKIHHIAENMI